MRAERYPTRHSGFPSLLNIWAHRPVGILSHGRILETPPYDGCFFDTGVLKPFSLLKSIMAVRTQPPRPDRRYVARRILQRHGVPGKRSALSDRLWDPLGFLGN